MAVLSALSAGRRILLSPAASSAATAFVVPARGRLRGPPRLLGWTKTQALDFLIRTNAGICALLSFSAVPFILLWTYRYQTVLKPAKEAREKARIEDLLSEGQAIKSTQ